LGVERRVNNLTSEKAPIKKPSNGPWNYIDHGKRLDLETGLHLGTWNIRTLNKLGAFKYVLDAKDSYKLDILALQEVRWPDSGNIRTGNTKLFYSKTKNGRQNGVGFMINKKILYNLKSFTSVNNIICYKKNIWTTF
jgi:hypothetical protein